MVCVPRPRMETAGQPPVADSVFMNDVFGAVVGEYFVFPAVDTPKSKDVPPGLSGIHRKTPYGAGTGRF